MCNLRYLAGFIALLFCLLQ